jgi:hypothetical protein
MKLAPLSFAFLLATTSLGCAFMMPQGGAQGAGGDGQDRPSNHIAIPKESKDLVRKSFADAYAQSVDSEQESLDKLEKETMKALRVSLGKEPAWQGGQAGESASTALRAVKAAKLKVRLEPITDGEGKAVNDDFLQLKDSYTDRAQALSRKMIEKTATKAEMKEMQDGAKYSMKLMDLRMAVQQVSMQTMMANMHVQQSGMQQMLQVSNLVRSYKMYEMEMNAEDYAIVKKGLASQKRAEAIAGATMAMMAAYQAVINGDGDPKALDMIAEGTLKAFPLKTEVTDKDARDYVASLGQNVQKVKARYEAMLRKVHGDKHYEKHLKAGIDAMFKQAEDAGNQKSIGQMADDHWDQYKKDIQTCKSKIDPAAEGRLGPSCKEVYRAAQSGDTSQLLPGTKKAFEDTGGMPAGGAGGGLKGAKLGSKESAALDGASAAANGDVDGTLDAASKLVGEDSTVGASLKGIAALKKGDAKGALSAAVALVPVPGVKEAFGLASKLLFKG